MNFFGKNKRILSKEKRKAANKCVLLASGHPAQVHSFYALMRSLEDSGTKVVWLASKKDISDHLLKTLGVEYIELNRPKAGAISKAATLARNVWIVIRTLFRYRVDLAVSRLSPYVSVGCAIFRIPHIGLADTESSGFYDSVLGRLPSALFTAESYERVLRYDQIRFKGNIELFYLHPNRFQNKVDARQILGLKDGERYVVMRFVSWDAYHDKGLSGLSEENKIKAVKSLNKFAKVFISAESELSISLEPYRINIPFEMMHDVLAEADLFFGESATMASESAVLGTPAIYLDKNGRGYTNEEEEFGLVYNFTNSDEDQLKAIDKALELLRDPNLSEKIECNRDRFLAEKIDVTGFFNWVICEWPESLELLKSDPEGVQERFKND